jgi:hypothetical protein
MKMRRLLFEAGNNVLRPFGLCIGRIEADFQTSVPMGSLRDLIMEGLMDTWGRWYDEMAVAGDVPIRPQLGREEFLQKIVNFVRDYRDFSGKNVRSGGLFLNNTVSLFAVCAYFQPSMIVDSGTYTGNSAWALARACPNASVQSFDITHVALRHRESAVTYNLGDWSQIIRVPMGCNRAFAFFDDHVDQIRRIEECAERNVRIVVFDDDTPVNATHNGHNEHSFPKASFAFWESARTVKALNWELRGRKFEVPIDGARLEHARGLIAHYSRLPDLYPVTGFTHQWPLSMAILR